MRKVKSFCRRLAILALTVCFFIGLPVLPGTDDRVEAAKSPLLDQAVRYLNNEYTSRGLINSDLGVGAYALFMLNQAGIDVSTWMYNGVSLKDAVISTVKNDISQAEQVSAKCLAQDLVAIQAIGQTGLRDQLLLCLRNKQGRKGFEDRGPLSIYGNVPAFDLLSRAGLLDRIDAGQAREYILGEQYGNPDRAPFGSWGSGENEQFYPDFMATAGSIRVLHHLDPEKRDPQIQAAIKNGLTWMKNQQKAGGNFMAGMDDTLIDTCEVIVTLKTLGIDPATWRSSEGHSAVDYFLSKALNPDGSFGMAQNTMDATWVIWACLALDENIAARPQAQPERQIRDIQGHWAEKAIDQMAVRAGNPVTRAEAAFMLLRLAEILAPR